MITANYHTHTKRCGHASGEDEDYILAAIKAGYRVLGFSDHAPYRSYPLKGIHMDWDELDGYIASISSLKEKYKDRIEIRLGLESEYSRVALEERKELKGMVEYLILGEHFDDPANRSFSVFRKCSEEDILEYARLVCEAMDTGLYAYVAHPDVIMSGQEEFSKACEKAAHMIGQKAEETGIPLEINCRGAQRNKKTFPTGRRFSYPNRDFWSVLSQYRIKGIVGIDAHDPRDLFDKQAIIDGLKEIEEFHIEITEDPFR